MKLKFLGTRGYIDAKTRRHRRHSSLLVSYRRTRIMIDCGEDWLGTLDQIHPEAVFVTHGHPDHAFGLRDGAPCPVFATADTWKALAGYPIADRRVITPRRAMTWKAITVEAFTVEHSIIAPAVGYRITAGTAAIFYVPDLVYIHQRAAALSGIQAYIGDGATIVRPLIRKRGDRLFGHVPIRTQIGWCEKEGVPKMIVTHCGSAIVAGNEPVILRELKRLGDVAGVLVEIAADGSEKVIR